LVGAQGRWLTEVLYDSAAIERRVAEMACDISRDYEGRRPLLVALLKGGVVFLADLIRRLTIDVEIDFISISSYQGRSTSSGSVRLLRDLDRDIYDRDVLIVEDIVDSGLSLSYIHRMLLARGPRSLKIATFLDKRDQRVNDVHVDYIGYRIPDRFVIGYGLDYQERHRGLQVIACLDPAELATGEGGES
jgi:hypoxanthine phosphoribosyltransferase